METKTKEITGNGSGEALAPVAETETVTHPYAGKKLIVTGGRVDCATKRLKVSRSTWSGTNRFRPPGTDVSKEEFVVSREVGGKVTKKKFVGGVPAEELPVQVIREWLNHRRVEIVETGQSAVAAYLI